MVKPDKDQLVPVTISTKKRKTLGKSTYIAKRLLPQVREMEVAKSPVAEILDLLGLKVALPN